MKYSIFYYLIIWSKVLLNSDFKTTARCPQPYRDTVMTFVPEARALVTEAGAAVSGPARLSRVRGEVLCRALSCPHRPSSHTALSVRSYVPPTSQGIVCSKVYSVITVWTVARRAPLSTGFSRQEYWSGLPCPPPGDLSDPGRSLMSLALGGGFFTTSTTWTKVLKLAQSASMSSWLG